MVTPYGRFRYTRLPFGLKVSSEIFQKHLLAAVGGLNGLICIADDLMIYGSGEIMQDAVSDHDGKLQALFQHCRDTGIRLNRSKLR